MKFSKSIFLLAAICIISLRTLAQGTLPDDPDSVPLDGGLSIALVAGIGYGAKKLLKNKKEKDSKKDEVVA
jgi:hypothetical protein